MSHPTSSTAYDRVLEAFTSHGLAVEVKSGRAYAQAPGHSAADRSVVITATSGQVLIYSHSDPTADVLDAVGLTSADLFDNPKTGITYTYADGRQVHRSPEKKFRQSGNTKGRSLFRAEKLTGAPDALVFVVEGEKDVLALEAVGQLAVCSAGGAGKAHLFDWTPLQGRTVVVVADKDEAGAKHAAGVVDQLSGIAESVSVVVARAGKDAADHIAAGHTVDEFDSVATDFDSEPAGGRRLKVVRGSEVKTKRLEWVIPEWAPAGALTLLAGREGLGKSTIAASFCAHITNGTLEGALHGQPRNVIYIHTEDAREFTVAPRLRAAGADMDRVLFIDVHTDTTESGTLVLPFDTSALERVIAAHDVAFVVLDAATSAMDSRLRGNDNNDVRAYLEPLGQLAARQGCVVLGLVHFGKRDGADTGKLILGSLAWSQVARSVLSVALDAESGNLVVSNTKGNLAGGMRTMEATIESATLATEDGETSVGVLRWLGESNHDVRDLLAAEDATSEDRSEAEMWLADYLTEHGRVASSEVKTNARKIGISESTLKRAAKKIGVHSEPVGFPRLTYWALPAQSAHCATVISPMREPTGPTEPTGSDQDKRCEPTEPQSQSAHPSEHEPTATRLCNICGKPKQGNGLAHVDCVLRQQNQSIDNHGYQPQTPGAQVAHWIGSGRPVTPDAA
ncbi:AAA family ATPase [Nocardia sp. NPDC050175]|uniref:AAA family ATPase n=1 Tax=Nocardia sp. NPDC050175 TaxID=3364317 RepID=UPI0037BC1030